MSVVVDQEELRSRAWLLGRHKVPPTWARMVAEVWLRLDSAGDGSYAHSDSEITRVATEMGKDKLAVVRAVAWLTVAARSGLRVEPSPEVTGVSGATTKGRAAGAGGGAE